jgi:uncharacterized protein (TIRG00374 family)
VKRSPAWLRAALWLPVPFLLYWALRDFRLEDTLAVLGRLGGVPLAALVGVNLLFLAVLTARWGLILRGLGASIPLSALGWYRLAGFAVSYLTPGPQFGGEPAQLALAKRGSELSYRTGSASLLLDKSFELTSNLTFLALGIWAIPAMSSAAGRWALVLVPGLLLVLPVAYLAASFLGRRPLSWLLGRLPRRLLEGERGPRMRAAVASVEAQVSAFGRRPGRSLAFATAFFVLVWGTSLLEMWLALRFLGVPVRFYEVLILMAGSRFAFLLPLPGGLGVLEATELSLFALLGLPPDAGWAFLVYIRARDLALAAVGLLAVATGLRRRTQPRAPRPAAQAALEGAPLTGPRRNLGAGAAEVLEKPR